MSTEPAHSSDGIIDYLCNSFLPDRSAAWDDAIARQGVPVKRVRDPDDSFIDSDGMVARMDDLGIDTLCVVAGDPHGGTGSFSFSEVTATPAEVERLATDFPDRFRALWSIDPSTGIAGVRRAAELLEHEWVVGLYNHVHSYDRPFDHADFYPYYALAGRVDTPVVMQAGTSGGLAPSECGRPIGVDRPAIYFGDTQFVLSHTGWPWVTEAIAMALKFPNVSLGVASYPPRHWSPELVDFIAGPGQESVLFGTNFPTVGHRRALRQLDEIGLAPDIRVALLAGNARRVFPRLPVRPR